MKRDILLSTENDTMRDLRRILLTFMAAVLACPQVNACPFCTAESRTLTEELSDSDAAVLARLITSEKPAEDAAEDITPMDVVDPQTGAAEFEVETILLGAEKVGDTKRIEAIFFGEAGPDDRYLIRGVGDPLDWAIPLELSPTAVAYVKKLSDLPESGADRLDFFQDYLEHEDPLLGQDAYDEFARAPYIDVINLKDRMDREQLLAWIESPKVSPSRRRLFLTMLGVCGQPEDIPRIERMLLSDARVLTPAARSLASVSLMTGGPLSAIILPEMVNLQERRTKLGLDAMIACYLTLKGAEGLDVIDQRFLTGPDVDYSHVYSTLMAIRFLAEESDLVPMERILQSARLLLDNKDFADQVIPDLARWEDWSVLDRLVTMYQGSAEDKYPVYVREPIITYLDVASEQEGKLAEQASAALEELEPIDPEAFKRARRLRAFGFLYKARGGGEPLEDNLAERDTGAPSLELQADEELPPDPSATSSQPPGAPWLDEEPSIATDSDVQSVQDDPQNTATDTNTQPKESAQSNAVVSSRASDPEPLEPPSYWLLLGAPIAALTLFFGIFWVILRSGTA